MRWNCTTCGKYADPQTLDYDTGECWDCQDLATPEAREKARAALGEEER